MAIDRRQLLIGGVLALASSAPALRAAASDQRSPCYVSACRRADGGHALALLSADGGIVREMPLVSRGHDVAVDAAGGKAVAFARQPGTFAVAFDPAYGTAPYLFAPPESRTFFGHGAFSADGRILYATENDLATGSGKIGIYDTSGGYARIGEFDSFGVGPHEVLLLADRVTLAIANGGYETLPESGRTAIAVSEMRPSLAFVDSRSGALVAQHTLAGLAPLSIRHLAEAGGAVWFGGQWEGDTRETPELIGRASKDSPLRLVRPPGPLGPALKGYIGSLAVSRDRRTIAASAPRAGCVLLIDAETGAVRALRDVADGCGLAPSGEADIVASSGHGEVVTLGDSPMLLAKHDIAFDNHLRALGPRSSLG